MQTRQNQREAILAFLDTGKSLTQFQAKAPPFRCLRLAARIEELRRAGYPIKTTMVAVPGHENMVAEYTMDRQPGTPVPAYQSALNL